MLESSISLPKVVKGLRDCALAEVSFLRKIIGEFQLTVETQLFSTHPNEGVHHFKTCYVFKIIDDVQNNEAHNHDCTVPYFNILH